MTKDEVRRIALECGFSAGRPGTSAEKIYKTYNGEWVNVTEYLCRFAEKIMAAERQRQRDKINAHIGRTTMSVYGTQPECKAARDALERLLDDEVPE